MNNSQFKISFVCPTCQKGKVFADGFAKVQISVHCPKCGRPYVCDLQTGKSEPGTNIRNKGRKK